METSELLNALEFFGLEKNFSRKEFQKSFHSLALKFHPDSGEFTTPILFIELIRYKEIIETALSLKEQEILNKKEASSIYDMYKEAKKEESEAILLYFKSTEGKNIRLKEEENPELSILKERLISAKQKFEKIVQQNPEGIWTEDSKNSIIRINIWLKS